MGATVPVAFDPKPRKLENVQTYKATTAILSGQLVGPADTAVQGSVIPTTSGAVTGTPYGFALHSAAAGEWVAVAGNGSELKAMFSVDTAANDAGDWVGTSGVAGCVILQVGDIAGHDSEVYGLFPVGQCQEDGVAGVATAGSTAYIIVNISPIWTAHQ
jgi:hypothetical protein